MRIETSSHELTLDGDHRYTLRRVGAGAPRDAWLESRRGEAFNRSLQAVLAVDRLELLFEHKSIGSIDASSAADVENVCAFFAYWNTHVGPTDLETTKTVGLLARWAALLAPRALGVKCCTYNCAGLLPDVCMDSHNFAALLGPKDALPQHAVVALAFQETDSLKSYKANPQTLRTASEHAMAYLSQSHTLVASVQLLGILTLVFVRNELAGSVANVRTQTTSTGLFGVWANKGAALARFELLSDPILGGGVEVSIVNCHLSAGEDVAQLKRRRWELREIGSAFGIPGLAKPEADADASLSADRGAERAQEPDVEVFTLDDGSSDDLGRGPEASTDELKQELSFDDKAPDAVAEAAAAPALGPPFSPKLDAAPVAAGMPDDLGARESGPARLATTPRKLVLVLGDLNYRVLLPETEVQSKAKAHEYARLLAHDSLRLEQQLGNVFARFQEAQIAFPPTYKYELGSGRFAARVPSYTDRVLFRTDCAAAVRGYASVELTCSDHRPVVLDLEIEAPCVDAPQRDSIVESAVKLKDEAENKARPILSVQPQQLAVAGRVFTTHIAELAICNDGTRPVHWAAEIAADSDNADGAGVAVTPAEGDVSMSAPVAKLRLVATVGVHARDLILLVRTRSARDVEDSVHKYVAVHVQPEPSFLGQPYEQLPRGAGGVPQPLVQCFAYLRGRVCKDAFTRAADSQLFQTALAAVDESQPFDEDTFSRFDALVPRASVYAVARVLAALVRYMPRPLPAEAVQHLATFVKSVEKKLDADSLLVWADLLYPGEPARGAHAASASTASVSSVASVANAASAPSLPVSPRVDDRRDDAREKKAYLKTLLSQTQSPR